MTSGIDVSHYQGSPNWPAVRRAGYEFAVLKTTESTNYADPSMPANRANAHAAGLAVGFYHFARGGDPASEADYFLSRIGTLGDDEFACLDWEISPTGVDPVAWCAAWCATVAARTGRQPFIYLNGPRIARSDWSPLVQSGIRLWLAGDGVNAAYDNNPRIPAVKWWGTPSIKQYSESGKVPGISGNVDLNVLSGQRGDLTGTNVEEFTVAQGDVIIQKLGELWNGVNGRLDNQVIPTLAGLSAAVDKLAEVLATGRTDLTAEELTDAVSKGIQQGGAAVLAAQQSASPPAA